MSNASRGKQAESKVKDILRAMGHTLVAEARQRPVWSRGRIVANDGAVDFLRNSIDLIHGSVSGPFILSQVTHFGSESARRQKLRAAAPLIDPAHRIILLWAWDADDRHFRVYRESADWLDEDWRVVVGDTVFPWDQPTIQGTLT